MTAKEREFDFTDRDFERIRDLAHERAGIFLSPKKRDMVYSRIARRLRALGLMTFEQYLHHLEDNDDEAQDFVNALTTNLTSFFRESHHFDLLAEQMLAIAAKRRDPIKIWSSACSTGEEAYSLAMTAIETFGSWTPPVRILATDVDTNVLQQAKRGVYASDRVSKLDEQRVKNFFVKGKGSHAGMVKIRSQVQDLIHFNSLNLLAPNWPVKGPFDAIFCRNVMIYFDKPTQYKVLSRFHPMLREDGLLYAGHSESFQHAADLFRLRGKTVFAPTSKAERSKG
ncbi:CheR family methyltransferase [Marinospirillum alkaliphilum]|uniref:Chemotaxis protein methyltransferase n=1 Tax=Marinospirillum alkaliphilum DSM 21637 TaxID=1122209 RepID=A0A1K1UDE8_9GAMM|nr:CheR family methyltransferase [Marinospirillum alkaliphilum]SFX10397.1 chemotaxis protein methyltransferase CheR [Marinospirillum alkaliphilum DSM 21637]